MNRFFTTMILMFAFGAGHALATPNLPDYYPTDYEQLGTLNGVNTQDRFIVINDMTSPIARDLKVHTLTTRFGNVGNLHPGMRVGVTTGEAGSRRIVTDVWVLPAGYVSE